MTPVCLAVYSPIYTIYAHAHKSVCGEECGLVSAVYRLAVVKTPTVRYRNCNAKGFERLGYLFSRKFGLWLRLCCLVSTKERGGGGGGGRERKEGEGVSMCMEGGVRV